MRYPVAEKFKSIQGEGRFTGVPMAFIRLVGCSVGKGICTYCDTDFDVINKSIGGGKFTAEQLCEWAGDYRHICITGGEPLDRDIKPLIDFLLYRDSRPNNRTRPIRQRIVHIETSGSWFDEDVLNTEGVWGCVSPKPGWLNSVIHKADEIKVIYNGLADDDGWPTVKRAIDWAEEGKLVYLQPRNAKFIVDMEGIEAVHDIVTRNPVLKLSAQMHKFLQVR